MRRDCHLNLNAKRHSILLESSEFRNFDEIGTTVRLNIKFNPKSANTVIYSYTYEILTCVGLRLPSNTHIRYIPPSIIRKACRHRNRNHHIWISNAIHATSHTRKLYVSLDPGTRTCSPPQIKYEDHQIPANHVQQFSQSNWTMNYSLHISMQPYTTELTWCRRIIL